MFLYFQTIGVCMHILFADKFPEKQLTQLKLAGYTATYNPDLLPEDLPRVISGKNILVVRGTRVEADTIQSADQLKLIIRAGAGTNTIDKACAAECGIPVCNVPGKNSVAVAELTLGLLLCIDRNIPDNVHELRSGKWNKKKFSVAQGLMGRTFGIIGAGSIGMAVAERATAFGMKVLMIEKPGRSSELLQRMAALSIDTVRSVEELVEQCDIVSIHVPSVDSTRKMVNSELLSHMREGSILLNTSRGEVVDEKALLDAIDSKGIRAGLDVYANEPAARAGEFDSKLAKHPNVYGTHHIGASTSQAQNAVADGVIEIVNNFKHGNVLHCVNQQ